jgi:hypothetical protein
MSNFDLRTRESRRSFMRKASYVAPAILTLNAVPAFASHGSTRCCDDAGEDTHPFDPGPQPHAPRGRGRASQTGFGG